jgi:hypothetical protein
LYGSHLFLRSRFQGPRWITIQKGLLRCFRDEITCLEWFKLCFVDHP